MVSTPVQYTCPAPTSSRCCAPCLRHVNTTTKAPSAPQKGLAASPACHQETPSSSSYSSYSYSSQLHQQLAGQLLQARCTCARQARPRQAHWVYHTVWAQAGRQADGQTGLVYYVLGKLAAAGSGAGAVQM